MSTQNPLPDTVSAPAAALGAAPRPRRLLNDLKLLFAALGAGNSVVPLGDNARAARLLSEYAASLQKH
jgi:hypothetical protein